MAIRIFHTADLHVGMKFTRGYPPEVQEKLIEGRFETLRRMVGMANQRRCDLFVIAGDLFDHAATPKKDVVRVAETLKEFEGRCVLVLPGNHDAIQKGEEHLWTRFQGEMSERTLLLENPSPYDLRRLGADIVFYPGPCTAKHSGVNAIGWIRETPKDRTVKYHIGVAHGSLEGFSPDFEDKYYPMETSELLDCGMDLWLLGHTHTPYPSHPGKNSRIFYPGIPEPDGFDCPHEGTAWILELGEDRAVNAIPVSTGTYRFVHDDADVKSSRDLETLKRKYESADHSRTLAKIKLRGRLPREEYATLSQVRRELESRLFYLGWDEADVAEEITVEGIQQEFTEGSFPFRLLTTLAQSDDSEALQIAYELLQGQREKNKG